MLWVEHVKSYANTMGWYYFVSVKVMRVAYLKSWEICVFLCMQYYCCLLHAAKKSQAILPPTMKTDCGGKLNLSSLSILYERHFFMTTLFSFLDELGDSFMKDRVRYSKWQLKIAWPIGGLSAWTSLSAFTVVSCKGNQVWNVALIMVTYWQEKVKEKCWFHLISKKMHAGSFDGIPTEEKVRKCIELGEKRVKYGIHWFCSAILFLLIVLHLYFSFFFFFFFFFRFELSFAAEADLGHQYGRCIVDSISNCFK